MLNERVNIIKDRYNIYNGIKSHIMFFSIFIDQPWSRRLEEYVTRVAIIQLLLQPHSGDQWHLATPALLKCKQIAKNCLSTFLSFVIYN